MKKKLLSFDVSSISTGWSLLEYDDETYGTIKLIDYGIIKILSDYDLQLKLLWFKYHVHMLLFIHKPDVVVIEETYLKNVKTLKTLMQFIGVLNLVCGEILEVTPEFVSPNSVRSMFKVGSKEEAFDYVKSKYKVKLKNLTFEEGNDITDSILQGLYRICRCKGESNG